MTDQQEDASPSYVTDAHLEFLDVLRESGVTNMFGAAPYVNVEYPKLTPKESSSLVCYWMKTYGDRHPKDVPAELSKPQQNGNPS